ncbi:MAG: CDGSH iron-sulfur domain-containing protein [Phycisphaerales bacterium]|nr:CDGSH iron-sulfur domain-containing protein [Phycisphaerales bacterium]
MARLIRHEADGPIRIDPQEKPVFICACGLSQNLPHCDGSHAAARKEESGKCYLYDRARTTVVETRDDE